MATKEPTAFDRVFPRKELFQGDARWSLIWGIPSALLILALLLTLLLLTDLLVTEGTFLRPPVGEAELELADRIDALVPSEEEGVSPAIDRTLYREANSGILPSVWSSRRTIWGGLFAALYREVPLLRENSSALVVLVLTTLVISLLLIFVHSRIRVLSHRAASQVAVRLQKHIHRQCLRLGPSELDDKAGSHVLELFSVESEKIRMGLSNWISRLSRYPLELIVLLLIVFSLDWLIAVECLVPVFACWFLLQRAHERARRKQALALSQTEAELRLLTESFAKTRLVRGYNMEDFEHKQFQSLMDRYQKNLAQAHQGAGVSLWVTRFTVTICAALVLFLVGSKTLSNSGVFSVATAIVLVVSFLLMLPALSNLWQLRKDREMVGEAGQRLQRYLNQVPTVSQAVGAKFLQPLDKAIQFENVVYTPPNSQKPILNGLSLKIPAHETVAVVSLDPQEPRALAYLLPRFTEPTSGRVLYDGEDIGWATLESLRAETVFVSSTDPFFTGTVYENISCGSSDYSLSEVTEAAKLCHAHNFILKLRQGYETMLGEHGEPLDAGQSFRLSLARAILRKPAVMIIEEPPESLDADTKNLIDDAYNRITPGRTMIFLPSRLSTIRRANHIIVLHQGKVHAAGPHAVLVKKSTLYRHWEYIHFNEFRHDIEPTA